MAAALGLGLRPGDLALSLGTSGTASSVSEQPTADGSGAVAGFADASGRFLPLVCTLNATKVTDAVGRCSASTPPASTRWRSPPRPGSGGLVLVPHLDGERTPDRPVRPARCRGSARTCRASSSPGPPSKASPATCSPGPRGSASLRGASGGRLVLVGGGARSAAYRQVVADLTGRPVLVPHDGEAVARGAAVQAAAVLAGCRVDDVIASWDEGPATVVEPDPSADGAAIRATYAHASREVD
jgi:xylulokinase